MTFKITCFSQNPCCVFFPNKNTTTEIDESFVIPELAKLERLELAHNSISSLSDAAAAHFGAHLTRLSLAHNRLAGGSGLDALGQLTSLTALDLSHNALAALPAALGRLTALRDLRAAHNRLVALPAELFALPSLTRLDASSNALTALPAAVGRLTALARLDLANNRLQRLPPELRACTALAALALGGNPWQCPPAAVCERGAPAVLHELERLASAHGAAPGTALVGVRDAVVGAPWRCTVAVADAAGVPRIAGGDAVRASLEGPALVAVGVTDAADGTYTLEAQFSTPGRYELRVTVEGAPLPLCPLPVNAWPSAEPRDEAQIVDAVPVLPDEDAPFRAFSDPFNGVLEEVEDGVEDRGEGGKEKKKKNKKKNKRAGADASGEEGGGGDESEDTSANKEGEKSSGGDGDGASSKDNDSSNKGLAGYARLRALCREYNVPLEVPEVVVCGSDGYEQLVEAVWGVVPFGSDAFRGQLLRPVQINFVYREPTATAGNTGNTGNANDMRVTMKRDKLLGEGVTGGARDVVVQLEAVGEYIRDRNSAVSAVPIVLQIETARVATSTVLVAPALPPPEHPARAELEHITAELLQPPSRTQSRTIVCVLPCTDWRLVQTLPWVPRVLAADPALARTVFVFSGLAQLLTTLSSPAALAEWLRGRPARYRAFFVSLLGPGLYAASKTDALYKRRLWQLAARDAATLARLQCDARAATRIGVARLRAHLASELRAAYARQAPGLAQHLAARARLLAADRAALAAQRTALADRAALAPVLRTAASTRTTAFCAVVRDALRGSVAGVPAETGRTLAEELADLAERRPALALYDDDNCSAGATEAESVPAVLADVPHRECRLYGGAQLARALDVFRACATAAARAGVAASGASGEAAASISTVAAACEHAQRRARAVLAPLIARLCDAATQAVALTADVADTILAARDQSPLASSCIEVGCTKFNSNSGSNSESNSKDVSTMLLPRLFEYSYLAKSVKAVFVELAGARIGEFERACAADLLLPLAEYSLPALAVKGDARDCAAVADAVFASLVKSCRDSVALHFFATLLRELTVCVPAEMHATFMSMEDAHTANMFKLQALENALAAEDAALAAQLSAVHKHQDDAHSIVL